MSVTDRQVFLHGPLGQRQFKEVLAAQLSALIISPEILWLVSPWTSDFDILDNRAGDWNLLDPGWGCRRIFFLEVLTRCAGVGCPLRIVVRDELESRVFVAKLKRRLPSGVDVKIKVSEDVHSKSLLSGNFFIKGSLNYTFSGATVNDEFVTLTRNQESISEALIEFGKRYRFDHGE